MAYNYENNYEYETKKGDIVKSRGEQIIADLLYSTFKLPYEYENKFTDNATPDFTVYAPDGKVIIWEFIGPGMLEEKPNYLRSLGFKYQLYQYLNPLIYRVIFSDSNISSEDVIKEWILKPQEDFFKTSLSEEYLELLVELNVPYYWTFEQEKQKIGQLFKINLSLEKLTPKKKSDHSPADSNSSLDEDIESYWIIDTSSFRAFEKIVRVQKPNRPADFSSVYVLNFGNTCAFLTSPSDDKKLYINLHEAWRMHSGKLERLDFEDREPQRPMLEYRRGTRKIDKGAFLAPGPSFRRYTLGQKKLIELREEFRDKYKRDDEHFAFLVAGIIESRRDCKSQIQIRVNQKNMLYRNLDSPSKQLKDVAQKTVHSIKHERITGMMKSIKRLEPDILDLRIVFEGDPNYVDITPSLDFDLESHIREISVFRRQYSVENKVWTPGPDFQETNELKTGERSFTMFEIWETAEKLDLRFDDMDDEPIARLKQRNRRKNPRSQHLENARLELKRNLENARLEHERMMKKQEQIQKKVADYPELKNALNKDLSKSKVNIEDLEILEKYYCWRVSQLRRTKPRDINYGETL